MTLSIITQYLLKIGCKIGLCARVSVCLIALFTSALSSVTASAQNSLTAMRLGNVDIDGQMALRLVVETAVPQQAKMLLLSDPWRLVLDYDNMEWAVAGYQL